MRPMEEVLWQCEHEDVDGFADFIVRVMAGTEAAAESHASLIALRATNFGAEVNPDTGEWSCFRVNGEK